MDLLSAFKRKTPPRASAAPAAGDADEVQRARTRARQRLIGAAVLVVAGIIGFPLLFETQPRPISVDLPIEIPRKEGAPALAMPAPAASTAPAATQAAQPATERVITETPAEAGREVSASAGASAPASAPARAAAPAPAAVPAPPSERAADAARAQALLDGKPVPSASGVEGAAGAARFVVQVGAFADANSVREARAKVEKLGLKTYTHVAQTPDGARTRVRVGPFATRAEAERAAAKLKAAALPAAILTL